jgi:CheY-like chemotaxis protein
MTHQVAEYVAAGMDDHVAKPIEAAQLFRALEQALQPAEPTDAQTTSPEPIPMPAGRV